jgi:hypothetical protein
LELIELARGTWVAAVQEISRECAGGAAHVRSSGAHGSVRPTSPLCQPLQALRYDEQRRELEMAIGLDADERPTLRCFVSDPQRIFAGRWKDARVLLVCDRTGTRTLIRLAATRHAGAAPAAPEQALPGGSLAAGTGAPG